MNAAKTSALRQALRDATGWTSGDEGELVNRPLLNSNASSTVPGRWCRRFAIANSGGIEAFLNTYDLSSREGVVLMCMAEALLRIPDTETVDLLIATDRPHRLGAPPADSCAAPSSIQFYGR